MTVYVLLEAQDGNPDRPVAVVSKQEDAEFFYQQDPKNRDWIPFNMDENPVVSGTPAKMPERHPIEEHVINTSNNIAETNKLMREMMEEMKKRRKN